MFYILLNGYPVTKFTCIDAARQYYTRVADYANVRLVERTDAGDITLG